MTISHGPLNKVSRESFDIFFFLTQAHGESHFRREVLGATRIHDIAQGLHQIDSSSGADL
jgi:hypothetical protein